MIDQIIPCSAFSGSNRRSGNVIRATTLLVAGLVSMWAASASRADIFVTTSGDEIEAELLEDLPEAYRLRTRLGIVDLEKDRVTKIIAKRSPWAMYEQRRKKCASTADAHFKLAQWCDRHDLGTEARDELERVIQLDPNHAAAREKLGYVRDDKGRWKKPGSARAPSEQERRERRQAAEEDRLVRKLVTSWFVKIKALHKGRLGGAGGTHQADLFKDGREQILAIRDPLAIPALAGVLSTGQVETRLLMVESLSRFPEDEATMNLLVASLLDPAATVRSSAAAALRPRDDDRVVHRLVNALYSDEEAMIRHAAVALGVLKAGSAVEDLINVLSKETRQKVSVARPVFLDGVRCEFGGIIRYHSGTRLLRYQPATIGCLGPGTLIGTIQTVETQTLMVHRTEVQEALIAITGQNFGFDASAWRNWLAGQKGP
ncbi:MAG: HEAT repeat domain-containing protein [Phycisphaerae bacterium]|nr:HEAT repeat domain-containing protein [Phycisphaerae bacterium]